jgi:hypothetical protein
MEYRTLGESDVKVSEVSLGCWTMGGLNWIEGNAVGWANVEGLTERGRAEFCHFCLGSDKTRPDPNGAKISAFSTVFCSGTAHGVMALIVARKCDYPALTP